MNGNKKNMEQIKYELRTKNEQQSVQDRSNTNSTYFCFYIEKLKSVKRSVLSARYTAYKF